MNLSHLQHMSGFERFGYIYEASTKVEQAEGKDAYRRYHNLLTAVARETGHTVDQACGVFSALSPNNDYLGNLRDARALLRASQRGAPLESFSVSTYGANKLKAWAIAQGEKPADLIVALKTYNFYRNLRNPLDCDFVTIDGHMANIWRGQKLPLQTRNRDKRAVAVSTTDYRNIAADVQRMAHYSDLVPCEMQAILWLTWRRLHGITKGQMTLWDRDAELAGMGFTVL